MKSKQRALNRGLPVSRDLDTQGQMNMKDEARLKTEAIQCLEWLYARYPDIS